MTIFTITTIRINADKDGLEVRTVGWYQTLEKANGVLFRNAGDLDEAGWYPFAVIEEVCEGTYPEIKQSIFYCFNKEKKQWELGTSHEVLRIAADWNQFVEIG